MLDHHIDPAPIRELHDLPRELRRPAVEAMGSSLMPCPLADLGAARGDNGPRADTRCELQSGKRHLATNTLDGHRLLGLKRLIAGEHAEGGQIGGWQGSCLLQIGSGRQSHKISLRHHAALGKGDISRFAQIADPVAKQRLAEPAKMAGAAEKGWLDDDPCPGRKGRSGIASDDLTCRVKAKDHGQSMRDVGPAATHIDINAIETGPAHRNPDPTGWPRGFGLLAQAKAVWAIAVFEHQRQHGFPPSAAPRRMRSGELSSAPWGGRHFAARAGVGWHRIDRGITDA